MRLKTYAGRVSELGKRVIACLDVRSNDQGDLVVTKGDQYDVREASGAKDVRNLGLPVELAERYFVEGADEVTFLNITGFRDFPLADLPMLEVSFLPVSVDTAYQYLAQRQVCPQNLRFHRPQILWNILFWTNS